jgi:hypothetical protein
MFAFADPQRVSQVLTAAGWAPPRLDKLDLDLDIAVGHGLEEAVVQSTQIGAVNSWLRGQPTEVVAAAIVSIRESLAAHLDGASVRLPGAMWLVSSAGRLSAHELPGGTKRTTKRRPWLRKPPMISICSAEVGRILSTAPNF